VTKINHLMLVAAGTGGHVFPAMTIGKRASISGVRVSFCTTKRGSDNWSFPKAFKVHHFGFAAFRGKGVLRQIGLMLQLAWVTGQSIIYVLRNQPDAVLAMGGYLSVPIGLAAFICRVPLFIHEQNAVAGLANRLLAPLAVHRFCAYDSVFKNPYTKVGNPIDEKIFAVSSWQPPVKSRKLRLLVLGGSQGASSINQLVVNTLKQGGLDCIDVWHQTGQHDFTKMKKAVPHYQHGHYQLTPFIKDMAQAYQWSDMIISRAGALSLAEIMHVGRYALLIPLSSAVDNHQLKNAFSLKGQIWGEIWQEATCFPDRLAKWLDQFSIDFLSKANRQSLGSSNADTSADLLNQICKKISE
jgi:UDP-N-acetylglucosamine--N-acetylmuramyl-(pentapeptide) pyrophosphoryl-undecaprenol N-acetylglucosamine transferase